MDEIVELMARAILDSRLWQGAWEKANEVERSDARYKACAAISALHARGWRIVPVEPTEEMMAAGVMENDKYATEIAPCSAFRANDCYRAMLDASPGKKG